MKIKLKHCLDAYFAVGKLSAREWSYRSAYTLYLLKKELEAHARFFTEKETELMETYGKRDEHGNVIFTSTGAFELADGMSAEYLRAHSALAEIDVTLVWEEQEIDAPERITPDEIAALEGFLAFRERGGNDDAS